MNRSIVLLLALLLLTAPSAFAAESPLGLWLTQNHRSVIEITPCPADKTLLCGTVHWIIAGGMQFDSKNPDKAQHATPMCNLPILLGFKQKDAADWDGGMIYKADDGDMYHATLQLQTDGTLLVRGYIGIPLLGQSQTWTRADVKKYPHCNPAKG